MGIFRNWFKKKQPVNGELPPPASGAHYVDPPWMRIARAELGTKEVPGAGNNPRILKYHAATTLRSTSDSIAWCSAFVCWCLEEAGVTSCKSAWAQSHLDSGKSLPEPRHGCLVIFRWSDGHGHVAFWDAIASAKLGGFQLLGGNQSDAVCIKDYSSLKSHIVGLRWPSDFYK